MLGLTIQVVVAIFAWRRGWPIKIVVLPVAVALLVKFFMGAAAGATGGNPGATLGLAILVDLIGIAALAVMAGNRPKALEDHVAKGIKGVKSMVPTDLESLQSRVNQGFEKAKTALPEVSEMVNKVKAKSVEPTAGASATNGTASEPPKAAPPPETRVS